MVQEKEKTSDGRSKIFKRKRLHYNGFLCEECTNMKKTLNVAYDEQGDVLEVRIGEPTEAYYEEIEEGIFQRRDEKTKEIKGVTIFSLKKRMEKGKNLDLAVQLDENIITM